MIQPSQAARTKFLVRVHEILHAAQQSMSAIAAGQPGPGLVQTLDELDNTIRGWAHAHSFCNAASLVAGLDHMLDEQIAAQFSEYNRRRHVASTDVVRRLLGVQLIGDVPRMPIVRARHAVSA